MTSPTFGTLLRQLRKRAGMTQREFAMAVGYSISFICDLEQNRRQPTVAVVLQQFIPALGLQEEAAFATQLVELAALTRGERPPPTATFQRTMQLVITDTFSPLPPRLPAPPTELLGREQEATLLAKRLRDHHGRLITLVGPPGVGKTRLALEVATRVQRLYKDGAHFVALAALSDPELVATAIATKLELPDRGKQAPQTHLIRALRQKELLLVLDNFEQILTAAGLLATLLAECPGLHLVVTSRERLHLRAEQRFLVSPLALDFAVLLFVQRAQAVDVDFEPAAALSTIQAICRRLDCLPLSIELIAARIDLFSPQSMLARLQEHALDLLADNVQDAPVHQRTLRHAIQYSYALLAERERALFRTLGVFVDGFDLAAVTHFGFDAAELQALLNKNLVHRAVAGGEGERRFLLLEMLREYALEQLMVNQEAEGAQQRHAAYYLQVVETVEPKLFGAQMAQWLAYLETEHNNVRAALTWALATGDSTTALRICGAIHWHWGQHGHAHEGKRWCEKALAAGADAPAVVRARAFSGAGHMNHLLFNHVQAQMFVEQGLAIYQATNDLLGTAKLLLQLGGIHRRQHHYDRALLLYQQSFDLFQALEDQPGIAAVYTVLGNLAMNHGDLDQAKINYQQGLRRQRQLGDQHWIKVALQGLALVACLQREYQRGILYCEELFALAKWLGDAQGMVYAFNQLGSIALAQDEFTQATHYLAEGFTLAQTLGYPSYLALNLTYQGDLALAQADFELAQRCYCQSLQIAHQVEEKLDIAGGLESLAGVAGAQADGARAGQLLGAAESLRALIGVPVLTHDQPRYQRIVAAARAQLSEIEYTAAYAAGYAMSSDQAVAFALAQPTT